MPTFKLALAQIPVIGGQPAENLQCALDAIARAGQAGAAIILLPEALDCGWCHGSALTDAGPIPNGQTCLLLREAAKSHGLYVCAGLVERAEDCIFNSAVLISPTGEILLHHRKINELELAQHLYARGDRLAVAHTALGTLGLMICADGFANGQVISRTLGQMGAQLILSPCAWAVPPDHDNHLTPYGHLWLDNYGPVAREYHLWIAAASNVGRVTDGEWTGHHCIGSSLVMDPHGHPALRGPYGRDAAALLFVEITLAGEVSVAK